MSSSSIKTPSQQSRYLLVAINFCLGLGLSVIAAFIVWKWEQTKTQSKFEREVDNITHALQYNLEHYSLATQFLGGFYQASELVKPKEFGRFADKIFAGHPGILAVGWSPQVQANQRATYERSRASTSGVNFRILEHDPQGRLITAKKRTKYYPITYIESKEQKLKGLLGYDLSSENQHLDAIERAKNQGSMVMTRNFFLRQKLTTNFVIYQPLYQQNSTSSPSGNLPQLFQGVVYIVYQPKVMVENALKGMKLENIDFYLYNGSLKQVQSYLSQQSTENQENFILFYDRDTRQVIDNPQRANLWARISAEKSHHCPYDKTWVSCVRTLRLAGEQWSIVFVPKLEFDARSKHDALATLFIGLFATGTLTLYLWMSIRQNLQTERLLLSLTEEVKKIQ